MDKSHPSRQSVLDENCIFFIIFWSILKVKSFFFWIYRTSLQLNFLSDFIFFLFSNFLISSYPFSHYSPQAAPADTPPPPPARARTSVSLKADLVQERWRPPFSSTLWPRIISLWFGCTATATTWIRWVQQDNRQREKSGYSRTLDNLHRVRTVGQPAIWPRRAKQ
jgi:hypothetical protein